MQVAPDSQSKLCVPLGSDWQIRTITAGFANPAGASEKVAHGVNKKHANYPNMITQTKNKTFIKTIEAFNVFRKGVQET
ncbi:MAG: hypothetical protein DRI57_01910 [Deltaproteobacteria bacterium]|nr:MAG: hypothetical protein DRI57_01910 [Deltaproteobacteria bacterium]